MKILHVTNFFKPSWETGGPARVAYELSKKLVERGHEVTVYTTDGFKSRLNVKKNSAIDVDGIKVYYFRNLSNYLAGHMNMPVPYYLPFVARREIRDFDVIHIHEHRTMLAAVVRHYAKKYGVPYVLQPHGSTPRLIAKKRRKWLFDAVFGYGILKDASKLIALTRTEAEQYKKMGVGEDKIKIVPNGIDPSEYENLPERGEFRKRYSIREDEKIILYLGRIHERKGIDLLVKAFADLVKELGEVRLIIVGPDDGFLSKLKRQIEDLKFSNKILLTGPLYEKDKLSAYVDADVLVYPAIFEIFGLVPFEAIMCGTPVIVTDDCGCGELVEESGSGYLVKYGDISDLKEKLKWVIENPAEGKAMTERGRRYIKDNLTWEKVVENVECRYTDCIVLANRHTV
jgi:glycosyltransferase involved in cell wall biosynthesis